MQPENSYDAGLAPVERSVEKVTLADSAGTCEHGQLVGLDDTSDPRECQRCDWCERCEGIRIHLAESCVACGRVWGAA